MKPNARPGREPLECGVKISIRLSLQQPRLYRGKVRHTWLGTSNAADEAQRKSCQGALWC